MRKFTQELNAKVPAGQWVLLGGWETKPGKRTFVLAAATRINASGNVTSDPNARQATIESQMVELTEAAARDLGLNRIRPTNGDQEGLHQLFRNEETQDLLKRIKETEGADILSIPRVTTVTGVEANLSIPQSFQAPNGHELHLGPMINILPNIDSKTDGIELAIKAEMNLRTDNEVPKL